MNKAVAALGGALVLLVAYLLAWPVPVDPVAWESPPNPGYEGPFEDNDRLAPVEKLSIENHHGPEDLAIDARGRIYAATHEGAIIRLDPEGKNPQVFAETGGRPLGIEFSPDGRLMVADAMKGLLSISPGGSITTLAREADGIPIRYADDVDVAENGRVYFSDASTKFAAGDWDGTYAASLLDILEHGGHGRLLEYDPEAEQTKTIADGIDFANGVAVSFDGHSVLLNETGSYRVLRVWIEGNRRGQVEPVIEALPGFPDNISRGLDGRYWVALVSPRSRPLDQLSDDPFLRKVVQRLPAFMRPQAKEYGHIIAIDDEGRVLQNLQDPNPEYPIITSVTETDEHLYLGSLVNPTLGRIPKTRLHQ